MNFTREEQIVRSFLLGDFHWIEIDSNGGPYSEKTKRDSFKGVICAKGKFNDFCFEDDEKLLKEWKVEEECNEWFPNNILHSSFNLHMVDKTGKKGEYKHLIKDIDNNTKLLLEVKSGSISGVNYSNGWEVRIGIVYKNIIFKLYHYKTSDLYFHKYQIESLYDIDYIRSLDFSNMKELKTTADLYIAEYDGIRIFQQTTPQDMADVLRLITTDDIVIFPKDFSFNFHLNKGSSSYDRSIFGKETLKHLNPKKILLQDNFDIEGAFEIPDSLEEIILDFQGSKYKNEGITEQFIDSNENLGKYLKCSDDCEKIAAREIYNQEVALFREPVNIWFLYKELSGFVRTNKYCLGLFEEFYKNKTEVTFKVGDAEFNMPIKKFWDCLKIEKDKKIKNKNAFEKGMSVFGNTIGYTAWFPKEVNKNPEYTGKTKISTKEFTEKLIEKEIKRAKKESFKKTAYIENILPGLKINESLEEAILKSIKGSTHDMFYESDGLDDDGADETIVFKIGDNFYEVDLHCEAEWVGEWSVRKNLPGKVSVSAVREIKNFKIEKEADNYFEIKY